MHVRVSSYASMLLAISLVAAIGCEDSSTAISYGGVTAPSAVRSTPVFAQPAAVFPNFLFSPACGSLFPFNLNLAVIVGSGQAVTVRLTTFELIDRFGVRAFPTTISTNAFPTPVPIPSSLPIPIPGTGSRSMPFSLQFGCGVTPAGTLLIGAETMDASGAVSASRLSVRIGA